jgi:predicted enzyme related to lactoylglutathione lyase
MSRPMLSRAEVTAILPVKELERAREFYVKRLGLEAEGLAPDGKFILRANGVRLALMPKPGGTKAEHTALSFKVDDIAAEIQALKARGVSFHDYDLPGFKTVNHVAVLGNEKAAWFSDPEGNILCLHEEVK